MKLTNAILCVTLLAVLACFIQSQTLDWVGHVKSSGTEYVLTSARCSSDDGVYVAGHFSTAVTNFGNGFTLQAVSTFDVFLAKYSKTGLVEWVVPLSGPDNANVAAVREAKDGSVFIAGQFRGDLNFTATYSVEGDSFSSTMYLAKYTQSGEFLWAKTSRTDLFSFPTAYSMAVAKDGGVYMSGDFQGTLTLSPTVSVTSSGSADMFVVKYSKDGDVEWIRTAGGPSNDRTYSVSTARDGGVFAVGTFQAGPDIVFSFSPTQNLTGSNSENIFIAKYSKRGVLEWYRGTQNTGNCYANSVTTCGDGGFFVSGYFSGLLKFEEGYELFKSGASDMFLAKYNSTGNIEWVYNFGGNEEDGVLSIAATVDGGVYLAGHYSSPQINFGNGQILSLYPSSQSQKADGCLVKFNRYGEAEWAERIGGIRNELSWNVMTAADRGAFLSSSFDSPKAFLGTAQSLTLGGQIDGFISKYSCDNCTTSYCFTIPADDYFVCSGMGNCTADDTCECEEGYTGDDCGEAICYGKSEDTNPPVCADHGQCVAPDVCMCDYGYVGFDCSLVVCFGKNASEPSICSGVGTCVAPDQCSCNSGYIGQTCQEWVCFSKNNTDDTVCSGQGTCVDPDQCICNQDYFAADCSVTSCFGINSNDSSTCSGHGYCSAPDTCDCDAGFTGHVCSLVICFEKNSSDASVCSGHGQCQFPDFCDCEHGYDGDECESAICFGKNSTELQTCSAHGQCVAPDVCNCTEEYFGSDCSVTSCFQVSSNETSVCSSHGQCQSPDQCECQMGYIGDDCSTIICFDKDTERNSSSICSGHGTCSAFDECKCREEYSGNECQYPICFEFASDNSSVCSRNGNCTEPDKCECIAGFSGLNCQYPTCYGVEGSNSTVCSQRGSCVDIDQCDCDNGYYGLACENFDCFNKAKNESGVCDGGQCVAANECICMKAGYIDDCTVTLCYGVRSDRNQVCSGRGTCAGPNTCMCESGTSGLNCEFSECFGYIETDKRVCSGNGECIAPLTCSCNDGYLGDECEDFTCFGMNQTDVDVCSGNGRCIAKDVCQCSMSEESGYFEGPNCDKCTPDRTGQDCTTKYCDNNVTCHSHGVCNADLSCECGNSTSDGFFASPFCRSCQRNYYGADCKQFCSTDLTCSGHGSCQQNGSCMCYSSKLEGFYTGSSCNECEANAYGLGCRTLVPVGFKFNNDGSSISGTWFTPQVQGVYDCSVFMTVSGLVALGSNSRCGYKTSTDVQSGRFTITLGVDPTIVPGDILKFNLLFTSKQVLEQEVTVSGPDITPNATAILKAPQQVSDCADMKIDGTESYSSDGRSLTFEWSSDNAEIDSVLKKLSGAYLSLSSSSLPTGSFNIHLVVINFFGTRSDQVTASVTKAATPSPVVKFKGSKRQKVTRGRYFRLDAYVELNSCYQNESMIQYEFEQVSGSSISYRTESQALIFDVNTFPAVATEYEFKVMAYERTNPTVFTTETVLVEVDLSPLTAVITGGSRSVPSNANFTVNASWSRDPDNSKELTVYRWSCVDLTYNGECPTEISDTIENTAGSVVEFNHLDNLTPGKYKFTVVYSKGVRQSSTSTVVEVFYAPEDALVPSVIFDQELTSSNVFKPDENPYVFRAFVSGEEIQSVQWYYDGELIEDDSAVWQVEYTPGEAFAKYLVNPAYADHLVRIEVSNSNYTVYAEYSFNMGSTPPIPGTILVEPENITMLHEVTFIASQWSIADCTEDDACKSQLSYQWTISEGDTTLLKTDKQHSNTIVVPGLPSGELRIGVTVYNSMEASMTAETLVYVDDALDCDTLVEQALQKVQQMTSYAQSSEANLFTLAIAKSQSMCDAQSRAIVETVTDLPSKLLAVLSIRFRKLDPAMPFSNALYGEFIGTLSTILKYGSIDKTTAQQAMEFMKSVLATVNTASNTEKLKPASAQLMLETLSQITQKDSSLSSDMSKLTITLLSKLSGSSLYARSFENYQYAGVTMALGTFPTATLARRYILSEVLTSQHTGPVVFVLPGDMSSKLVGVSSVQILSQVFAKSINPHPYIENSSNGNSVLSTDVMSLELKRTDGSDIAVSGISTPIAITLPAVFDLTKLRDEQESSSSGFKVLCKYFNEAVDKWTTDDTCRISSFNASSVTLETSHLTWFAVTYDFVAGESEPKPPKARKLGLGLGIGLGIGIPVIVIVLLFAITGAAYAFSGNAERKQTPKDIEMQETRQ